MPAHGYGKVVPVGMVANLLAVIELVTGRLCAVHVDCRPYTHQSNVRDAYRE